MSSTGALIALTQILQLHHLVISVKLYHVFCLSDRQTDVLSHRGQLQSTAMLYNNGSLAAYTEA